MSVTTVRSAYINILHGEPVRVEVDVSPGLYSFSIVGLPDKAIDESKDRIVAALKNTGLRNPKTENHKVTVSLAPADVKKEGSYFDLPITLAYLFATKQIVGEPSDTWFVGELSLTGDILPMRGMLALASAAREQGVRTLYIPEDNVREALLVEGLVIYGCRNLRDVVKHFNGLLDDDTSPHRELLVAPQEEVAYVRPDFYLDIKDIRGQEHAKRALEIAALGGHNIALYGPPGTGKTMLARAFTGLLPPLSKEEVVEVTRIHSVTRGGGAIITHPPFRSPHHTSSYVSIVGGGANPRPGEVTLAHRGVLFLDEFPEFDKRVIESLREPLEGGQIVVSRAKGTYTFPASCTVVAAMNPCPCGYMGSKVKRCTCTRGDIERYARKLSGPIVDRIDIWVPVLHVDYDTLSHAHVGEGSEIIRERVQKARAFGKERFLALGLSHIRSNKEIPPHDIDAHAQLSPQALASMKKIATQYALSPRSYHRVLRVARSIADLEYSPSVEEHHILEAFQYRPRLYEDKL